MKILIAGPGAVGCVLGGALLRNNHEAVFLARGNSFRALQEQGFRVKWPDTTWSWPRVRVLSEASSPESFDAVLFCVKGYDWETAAQILPKFPAPWVLTFQNGVVVHKELAGRVAGSVIGGVIYVAADRTEPGLVVAKAPARVVMDGGRTARAITGPLAEALAVPEVKVQLSDNIELDLWRKYLFLSSFSAINTLTEKPAGVILQDPDVRNLWIGMMREIAAIGQACGIGIGEADVETAAAGAGRFPPDTSSSLLADTLRKQRTEVELLQGHLVRLAAKFGVNAPISRALYALLKVKTQP